MGLNHNVWMPYFKFTMQTIAITYPARPNDVTKRKYYDLFHEQLLLQVECGYTCLIVSSFRLT